MEHQTSIAAAEGAPCRFMVERQPLAKAAEFLKRHIVERRNSIPVLANVAISPAACGGLDLYATDLDIFARITVPALAVAVEVPGAFTVDAVTLADVLKKADGHTVDLVEDVAAEKVTGSSTPRRYSTGRIKLMSGRARTNIASLPTDDMPILPDPVASPGAAVFSLAGSMLADMLSRVAPFMSKEEARYYLNGLALQLRTIAGRPSLVLVATNGATLARQQIDVPDGAEELPDIILPRKLVGVLQKALKASPGRRAHFLVTADASRVAIMVGDIYLVAKLIDGTFPQWELVDPMMKGEELQRLAFVDLDPSIRPADLEAFAKAMGIHPDVDVGERYIVFTAHDRPGFVGVATRATEDRNAKATYHCGVDAWSKAGAYAEELARSLGFDVDSLFVERETYNDGVMVKTGETYLPSSPHVTRGLIRGYTFGKKTGYGGEETVEVLCYETFTSRFEKVPVAEQWAEGSFSLVFPRDKAAMSAAVTFGEIGAGEIPLRQLANGTLELSAAAVARLVGDVSDIERVTIPAFSFHHGEIVAVDHVATDGTGRRYGAPFVPQIGELKGKTQKRMKMRPMTDREALAAYCADPAGFTAQLQPVFYPASSNGEPAFVEPDAAPEPVAAASEPPADVPEIVAPEPETMPEPEPAPAVEAPELPPVELPDEEPFEIPADEIVPTGSTFDTEPEPSPAPADDRLAMLESMVAELKARVDAMAAPSPAPAASAREAELEAENAALRTEIARLKGKRAVTAVRMVETRRALREARTAAEGHEARCRIFAGHYRAARVELARVRPMLPEAERAPKVAPGVRLMVAA